MMKLLVRFISACALLLFVNFCAVNAAPPNIVLIYADDLGYGDVGCYGATRVETPNIDRLAAEGLRFTDGHSPAATCTPSRYAMLTGQYAWRRSDTNILPGDAAAIIRPGQTTLASLLKQAGYATAVVGKWHLGLGDGELDWNAEIRPGPLEIGFDQAFIMPATGDRVPCVYLEDHRVVGLDPADPITVSYEAPVGDEPTGREHPELLKYKYAKGHDQTIVNGISRIGWMSGGQAARWVDEDMADVFTGEAVEFIEQQRDRPFFLYFATHDIHVPRMPHARFAGESDCGLRGDVIEQLDWCVGAILATLERLNLAENTLVIFTSDNGPVINDGYADGAVKDLNGHNASGPLRGGKYSRYEGATRVPFVVRWPAEVAAGESDALVCQVDFLASFAALVGEELPENAGPDSVNLLPALVGKSQDGRDELVVQGLRGLVLRKGAWKYIPADLSPFQPRRGQTNRPRRDELYDLRDDLDESNNLAAERPEMVAEFDALLERIKTSGDDRTE